MHRTPMRPEEAFQEIYREVQPTRQKVVLMKGALMKFGALDPALKDVDAQRPESIILHPDVDVTNQVKAASRWISFTLAGCQALWELVYAGIFILDSEHVTPFEPNLTWTTVYKNSGGQSGSWQFQRLKSSYPSHVRPTLVSDSGQVFADPDLYLSRIAIPNWQPEIGKAVRDSVLCFRNDLFTPCLVMLGKASEGAWIELGVTLAAFVGLSDSKVQRFVDELNGPETGFAKKMRSIMTFVESRSVVLGDILRAVGVTLHDLRMAMLWSDSLRDVRNTVHHGVRSFAEPTYETAVTLLMSGIPHLKTLSGLYAEAAKNQVQKVSP